MANASQNRIEFPGNETGLLPYDDLNAASARPALGSAGNSADNVSMQGPVVEDTTLAIQAAIVLAPYGDYAFPISGFTQSIETQITGDQLVGEELTIK